MSRSLYARLHRRYGPKLSGSERAERAHSKQVEFAGWLAQATARADCANALPNGVAVVGGGFAGLAAAWALGQAGVASTVFEARKTFGGRVESDRSLMGPCRVIETGAELIGSVHPMWITLARQFGLGMVVLTGEDQYAAMGLETPLRIGGKPVPDPEKLYKQMAFVLRNISDDAKAITNPAEPWTTPGAAALDAKSVADKIAGFVRMLPTRIRHPMLVEALELQLGNDNVIPTKEQSYLGLLSLVSGGKFGSGDVSLSGYWEHNEDFRCAEGNISLAGMMLEYGKRIQLRTDSPVTKIEISESAPHVRVTWRDSTGSYHSKNFDEVVLAVPPSVWKKISITPALPPGKEMALGPAVKFFSAVADRFWIKAGLAPNGVSDELGQTWESTENQELASRGITFSVFAGGAFVPKSDAEKHFRAQLLKLYPGFNGQTLRYADWPNVEWIETGYACPKVGQVTTIGKFLSGPHEKHLFFAGEHTSMAFFGYMEGALQSGARAANLILAACSKRASTPAKRTSEESATPFIQRLRRELSGNAPGAGLSPVELFESVLFDEHFSDDALEALDVLATESQRPAEPLRLGDWMISAAPTTGEVGHVSVLASDELLTESMLASEGISAESSQPGYYGLVIEAGASSHGETRPFARRLLDSSGCVPPNTILLRPRFPAADADIHLPEVEQSDSEVVDEEIFEDFDQFAEDDPTGTVANPTAVATKPATIGFEFDLNVGLNSDVFTARVADMPSGAVMPVEHEIVTDHLETDGSGKLVDGFAVKVDGSRLEIATTPITVDDDATFDAVVKNVLAFAKELEAERAKVKPDAAITVSDIAGHPVHFIHSRTKISKLPLVIAARGGSATLKWPDDKGVWAAPQATVTIPLARVGDLIDAIDKSVGEGLGKALSGDSSLRLGVRSDIVVKAKRRVLADRRARMGTELSDKSKVKAADYTDQLAGLLMLMTSYMLCGEILDSRDYEQFAKSYLPINVKAPFRDLFRDQLTARERQVFKELYFDNRANFFALAKDKATKSDEDNELFPPKARGDIDRFHSTRPTWGTLLDNTFKDVALKVTRANTVRKKKHAVGDEVLWAPLSSIIPFSVTKPRVALELRRIGFDAHADGFWGALMKNVRKLVRSLS
jgi:monoamine oxidase